MSSLSDNDSSSTTSARSTATRAPSSGQNPITTTTHQRTSPFRIPPLLKDLFDHFPLRIYPANTLPLRSPSLQRRQQNTLYIFSDPSSISSAGAPSPNPTSLKWQTALHIADIPFITVSSTNHASPSGSLPIFIPADSAPNAVPLTASTLPRWLKLQRWKARRTEKDTSNESAGTGADAGDGPGPAGGIGQKETATEKLYTTLLTHPVRLAYLYTLYLHPSTFLDVATPLYISTASRTSFVSTCLTPSLRQAALDEVLKEGRVSVGGVVDVERLFKEAEEAFGALSVLLGEGRWFWGAVGESGGDADGSSGSGGRGEVEGDTRDGAENTRRRQDEFAAQGGLQRDSSMGLFEESTDEGRGEAQADPGSEGPARVDGGFAGGPGMLDAAVFSYTQVILHLFRGGSAGEGEQWSPAERLVKAVMGHENLVKHRYRMLESYYGGYQDR